LERILSRIHAGRCKVKDFVRVLEAFQVIEEGIAQIKNIDDENQINSGLLGTLLGAFDGLKELLQGWEHAFDWEKAKEEGWNTHDIIDNRSLNSHERRRRRFRPK
jgi:DNA mismatch repair protein MSH6